MILIDFYGFMSPLHALLCFSMTSREPRPILYLVYKSFIIWSIPTSLASCHILHSTNRIYHVSGAVWNSVIQHCTNIWNPCLHGIYFLLATWNYCFILHRHRKLCFPTWKIPSLLCFFFKLLFTLESSDHMLLLPGWLSQPPTFPQETLQIQQVKIFC